MHRPCLLQQHPARVHHPTACCSSTHARPHAPTCCTTAVTKKVGVKGLSAFAIAPGKTMLAAFVPEAKAAPAVATVLDFSGPEPVTVCRRSFFRATSEALLQAA
jgi:hypothetical protein